MKQHTKNYFNYYGIKYYPDGSHDYIQCEVCKKKAVDLHHIKGRIGQGSDDVENIIALCRPCHEDAHNQILSKGDLNVAHRSNLY